jgi:glycosyltransferase involved in cell wall biosynthesis
MKVSTGRPKIGVFTKPLDDWNSGSGHHLNEILSHALDLAEGRFDFTFIHYVKSANPIYSRVNELLIPRNPFAASARLRREGFDVLHYSPLTVYAPVWGLPARKMATIHGVEQLLLPGFHGPLEMAHERFIVPVYARTMDAIVTVSETSARYFSDHFGVKPDRVTICYNGVGPAFRILEPRRDEAFLASRGVTGPFVFHISRFSERKNPWTLLEAFARFKTLRPGNKEHALVCAGKGWETDTVRIRAKALGIADRLVTPGFVNEDEVVRLRSRRASVCPTSRRWPADAPSSRRGPSP